MPDVFTKEKRKEIMSKIRSKNTKIELNMMDALRENNIPFEHQPKMFGRPDFLVPPNIVVFCDSSFWHGRNWSKLELRLSKGYWREHIRRNRERDKLVNLQLRREGYVVLRFWDEEITCKIGACIERIKVELRQ